MYKNKIFLAVLSFILIFGFSVSADMIETVNGVIVTEYYTDDIFEEPTVSAATIPMNTPPTVKAKSTVLMEASTGKILTQTNAHEKLEPASITKIMTLLLVTEAIDNGKISVNDVVTTSEHAASMGGSQIWLEPGETMTVDQMLKAAAVGSANDASVALAEHIAGSEEGFVALMNARAKELGMNDTTFKNACGLDEEGHLTSAHDVAVMSRELILHDTIKKYTTIWMDSLRGGQTQLVNTNKLVRYYLGATGLKTGTTSKAGFCVSATAKRDGMELIAVVMGGESSNERFAGAKKLLDYGFANWSITKPNFDASTVNNIKVVKGVKPTAAVEVDTVKNQLIKKGDAKGITVDVIMNEFVDAPVKEGTQVGKVVIKLNGEAIDECKIYTTENIDKITWGFSFIKLVNALFCV
ncbi:MAG: D-alanyl-D-alanine carboxypeptidase [Clostridia bacterium]|nr:D-alanyl-D-alanine carboxypeptidase [Clostridia bacterium]